MNQSRHRIALFSLAVVFVLFICGGAFSRPQLAARPNGLDDRVALNRLYHDYVQAMELIRERYPDEVAYETLTKAAVQGMLRVLDPHSNFYDQKAFEETRNEQRSQYYGIGAAVHQRFGGVYIIEPFRDTPAARAGLRYGDRIVAVDERNAEQWDTDRVRDHLRGELGTEVRVTVQRAGEPQPVVLKLERAPVDMPSISGYFMVKPGVGYIALSRGFHSTTADELNAALAGLREQGMHALVLDLRGNPGGFLEQAVRVADKFLQRGQMVVSVREREGRANEHRREHAAESGAPETFPLTVIIDEGSASASEIVAGAMQDHDRALIIGANSFGKGLVQTIFNLSGGAGLTLTTARYYTPSGRLIQRDYSNGSSYEYHARRTADGDAVIARAKQQQRRTDTGRTVYGGGGIEPDVQVAAVNPTNAQVQVWLTGLFQFVRELTAGRVAGLAHFKCDRLDFDRQPTPNEIVLNDDVLKAYRAFMAEFVKAKPEAGVTMQAVNDTLEFARQKIREEVLVAGYGVDASKRSLTELDPQLQRAVAELPNAAQLAERARKTARATR